MARTTPIESWTVNRVLDELPALDSFTQREALKALSNDQDNLRDGLRAALSSTEGHAQLNAAVLLLKLGDATGRDVFLDALGSADKTILAAATLLLGDLDPIDSRRPANYLSTKVPIAAAEIFAALSSHLAHPYSDPGWTAVWFGLHQHLPEADPVVQSILESGPKHRRLQIAGVLLRTGA